MWQIVRDALAGASPAIRSQLRWILAITLLMIGLQAWDSRDGRGAAGVAEFLSAMLGIAGVALLGLAHILRLIMQGAAARPRLPDDRLSVERLLLALPAIGFASGSALAGAAVLMLLRAMLGTEWRHAMVLLTLYSGLLVFAALTVTQSVQALFHFAAQQAQAASELRATTAAARLAALQARMNPHFLFNALNTVASLVRSDPPAAERVVVNLADVLRQTLDRSAATVCTVGEEVAFVRSYLALEQERWGDRLRITWNVAESAEGLTVPPLVLQPLVENSLRHGLGARLEGGTIAISIDDDHDRLTIVVEDDGDGLPVNLREGTGLGNLRQRLAMLYGQHASLEIHRPPSGARVSLVLPTTGNPGTTRESVEYARADR